MKYRNISYVIAMNLTSKYMLGMWMAVKRYENKVQY